jgi:glutathione peroxidase-family protein
MSSLLGKEATLIIDYSGSCDVSADGELGYQCKGIADLQKKYESKGFNVIMQLTEQFRDQSMFGEGDTAEDVRENMLKKFGIKFPILDYANVNGGDATDLYKVMKSANGISMNNLKKIDWNFEKFLLNKVMNRTARENHFTLLFHIRLHLSMLPIFLFFNVI